MYNLINIDYLLSLGKWTGVGNILDCEIVGCNEEMSDILWFGPEVKFCLCKKHVREYLSRRNRLWEIERKIKECGNI